MQLHCSVNSTSEILMHLVKLKCVKYLLLRRQNSFHPSSTSFCSVSRANSIEVLFALVPFQRPVFRVIEKMRSVVQPFEKVNTNITLHHLGNICSVPNLRFTHSYHLQAVHFAQGDADEFGSLFQTCQRLIVVGVQCSPIWQQRLFLRERANCIVGVED